ncbi:hypothetical protein Cgig2_027117 [Carnegiea gigantea]|uniref:Uncharacterized protein n=1 Tax=Carnegiea gigantea TaxID=171969 RepID=A0A9Q1GJX1_9CARY|nr:hypothetical protein Cgig2_027117 [Carnegiea gigantea]
MEVAVSAMPSPLLEYPSAHEGEPFHRPDGVPSLRPLERSREVARGQPPMGPQVGCAVLELIARSAEEQPPTRQPPLPLTRHTPASASKALVSSSSAAPPSDGGINSTSSGSQPSVAAHSRSSTKRRSACGLSQHLWYRETSPSSRRHSATAFTPRANTLAMAISSSDTFGGSEAPGATKSQDLTMSWTRESLMPGFTLIKLAEGRGVSEQASPATRVTAAALEGVCRPCLAGARSPDGRLPNWRATSRSALASPTCEGAEAPISPSYPSVLCFLGTGRLTTGLFS